MKTRQEYKEDPLSRYLNHESIEKAPEGFTSKVMSRTQYETVNEKFALGKRKKDLVPVISIVITVLLVAASLLIPTNSNPAIADPVSNLFKSISVQLPRIKIESLLNLNLPATLVYISVSILILTFFDRALNGIFHRNK
jgi:hypothetical protein